MCFSGLRVAGPCLRAQKAVKVDAHIEAKGTKISE
jgi:hypothetical protein